MALRLLSRDESIRSDPVTSRSPGKIQPKLHLILFLAALLWLNLWVTGAQAWKIPAPSQLWLEVRETAGIARINEVVRGGVPLPRSLKILSTGSLALVDAAGRPVPAEFLVLGRWNAGLEAASAPIQWLLVIFPATVPAWGKTTYRLVTDGSVGPSPAPPVAVILRQTGSQIIVDTGAATFALAGNPGSLFDDISLASGASLAQGGDLTATVKGVTYGHPVVRHLRIEYAGNLQVVVVLEGTYAMPAAGGGELASQRRYVFSAGSPTAIVRHAVHWEGDLAGIEAVNGLLLTQIQDTLALELTLAVTAIGDFASPAVTGNAPAGAEAWVRQALRSQRLAPLIFEVQVPGRDRVSGAKADGGVLAVTGASGTLAVALNHMHRYEPQALRLLPDGRLAVEVADNSVWLGYRQGLFATLAVSALPGPASRGDLDRLAWAPLNRPLHPWPQPEWFAASQAVDEFPLGALSAGLNRYDTLMARVVSDTLSQIDAKGLPGLMTFGVYPRYWGNPLYGDEFDTYDPTPAATWDNTYWGGTWTDYHNTVAAVPIWVMRTGATELLAELAFPAAWRTLHTQIMQGSPDDPYFYCGQAPAGYGGYRTDFNSSHAYFDNLFLYYWLTGDSTVVETIKRGACSMRNYLCQRRPAQPCLPDDPPSDEWARLAGRVASQWFAAFRFVGLASSDASYLDDWRSGLARAVTQHYVAAGREGKTYGFWLNDDTRVGGPGTYDTAQLWMASLYDMNNLYRLMVETEDAPLGNPPLAPSQVLTAWGRTLVRYGPTTAGDGTAAGPWPEGLTFSWSGNRLGGTLLSVAANISGSDPYLYDTNKATLIATLLRAADLSRDPLLRNMGADLTSLGLNAALNDPSPLGKIMGLYLARLPAAVARLSQPEPPGELSGILLLLME